jgi:hypothetical protein
MSRAKSCLGIPPDETIGFCIINFFDLSTSPFKWIDACFTLMGFKYT